MVLSDEADSGNAFDAVYSTAHADKDTKDHFISPASMLLEAAVNETGNEDAQRAKLAQHKASASPLAPPGVLLQACTPACVEEEAWRRRCGGGGAGPVGGLRLLSHVPRTSASPPALHRRIARRCGERWMQPASRRVWVPSSLTPRRTSRAIA